MGPGGCCPDTEAMKLGAEAVPSQGAQGLLSTSSAFEFAGLVVAEHFNHETGDRSTDPGAGLASAPHSSWTLESRCYSKSEGSHCRSKESHSGPTCRPGEAVRITLHSRIAI